MTNMKQETKYNTFHVFKSALDMSIFKTIFYPQKCSNKLDIFYSEKSFIHPGISCRRGKADCVACKIFLQNDVSLGKNQVTFIISFVAAEVSIAL
jgi:hypothetical protein